MRAANVELERLGQIADKLRAELRPVPAAPLPLPDELAPVEPFPLAALPEAFRPWVADVSERMQCPPDFVAVPLLVAAAAQAARHVAVRLKQRDDWTETGNLWAMLVGRPGVMKTPAMKAALAPIERLEAAAADEHNAELTRHALAEQVRELRGKAAAAEAGKRLRKNRDADIADLLTGDAEATEPTRQRFVVNSPTWEKLHAILAENPGGVLMVRDELRGWFLDLAREDRAETRSFFVQGWSGGAFTVDRIQRGTITVRDMRLSIVGAIQPGPLARIVRDAKAAGTDDGLLERFLVAWPDDSSEWRDVDRFPDSPTAASMREVFERLARIDHADLHAEQDRFPDGDADGMPFLRLDEAAREVFAEWHADLQRRLRSSDAGPLEATLSKFRHHVPALALALHLADGGTGPVAEAAMLRALTLGDYFESHANRLHGSGGHASVRAARAILAKARSGALPAEFTVRDAHRPRWSGLTENDVVVDAVDLLTAHRWLIEATIDTGGRRTAVYSLTEGARRG